ncbi:hypothetical protein L873DRAFT_1807811, partial [Choiromyces venosus 120613-1]
MMYYEFVVKYWYNAVTPVIVTRAFYTKNAIFRPLRTEQPAFQLLPDFVSLKLYLLPATYGNF